MAIVIVIAIIVTITILGWSGLLALLAAMVIFGLISIPMQRDWPFEGFVKGAVVAAMAYCGAFILCLVILRTSNTIFWIVFVAAMIAGLLFLRKNGEHAEESAKKPLESLRAIAEDFSHFVTDSPRSLDVFWSGKDHCVYMWLLLYHADSAKLTYDLYDSCQGEQGQDSMDKALFGDYKPTNQGSAYCYTLLKHGTAKFGEGSLMYEFRFADTADILAILGNDMEERYPQAYKKNSSGGGFSLKFGIK